MANTGLPEIEKGGDSREEEGGSGSCDGPPVGVEIEIVGRSNNHIVGKIETKANHNFTEVELDLDEREKDDGNIKQENHNNINNKISSSSNNTNSNNNNNNNNNSTDKVNNAQQKAPKSRDNGGWVRHLVALLALSSIVLANMNRQAFNQALVSMIRPIAEPIDENITTTTMINLPTNTTEFPASDATTAETTTTTGGGGGGNNGVMTTNWPETNLSSTSQLELVQPEAAAAAEAAELKPIVVDQELKNEVLDDDRFDWTGAQIATLQAAFSYGYTPFMIPGGRMSELYGAKWVVFISGFGSALCCALAPFFADTNYNLLVASRVLMGLCQTGVSPALYALLTRWLPPDESSVYLPMIKVAVMVGLMSGSLVSGFFTWRLTFYLVGFIGILWSVMWALVVSSDPSEHKFIGKHELDYIRRELERSNKGRKISMNAARKAAAPWIKILTNPVVVGFMLAKFTVKLSTDAQTMQIPMYLKHVFMVSKELNGILSALNFAIQGIFTGLVAWLAKEFIVRKSYGLNKTKVRRLFQGTCNFGMAFAYILITFNMSSLVIVCCAVILLSVASMFGAGGEAVTPVDLSTDYSASIMAIANSSANLSGIILPSLVSFVLGDHIGSSQRWNLVWWIVGGISFAGGLVYTCRVDAEIQDFSSDSGNKQKVNKKKTEKNHDEKEDDKLAIEMRSRDGDTTTYV